MFNPKPIPKDVQAFFLDLSKQFSKVPREQKMIRSKIGEIFHALKPSIDHLRDNPEKIQVVMETFANQAQQAELMRDARNNGAVSSMGRFVTMSLLTAGAAAQNVTGWEVSGSQAPGGPDMCSGIVNCLQAHITYDKLPVASLSAFLDSTLRFDASAVWAFMSNVDAKQLANQLVDILAQNVTQILPIKTPCAVSSTTYIQGNKGSTALILRSNVNQLTQEDCMAYQNTFNEETQNFGGQVYNQGWAIAGICIGIVLCCCLTFGSVWCCLKGR